MTGARSWPALAGMYAAGERATSTVERATWGKVHGASTDFRWIAATRGFFALAGRAERELSVGTEDSPAVFALWRAGENVLLAARCHPSRAVDASGRGGALEKQVLACRRDAGLPTAAAAALLLTAVEELDDRSWWEAAARSSAWEDDPSFVYDFGEGRQASVPYETLESSLAASSQSLRSWLAGQGGEDLLTALYAGLLAGERPLFHGSAYEQPLPGSAVAALLLPFERLLADRLSVACWLPSSRRPHESLGERWDLVVHDDGLGPPAEISGRSRGALERARIMARAVLRDDPGALQAAPRPKEATHPVEAPPARGTDVRPQASSERRKVAFPVPLDLPEPPTPSDAWRLLHELARDPKRRWVDPRRLAASVRKGSDHPDRESVDVAAEWIRALEKGAPAGVSREQWETKVDLLRAAVLALAPGPETARAVGRPRSGRVPEDFYVQAVRKVRRAGSGYR